MLTYDYGYPFSKTDSCDHLRLDKCNHKIINKNSLPIIVEGFILDTIRSTKRINLPQLGDTSNVRNVTLAIGKMTKKERNSEICYIQIGNVKYRVGDQMYDISHLDDIYILAYINGIMSYIFRVQDDLDSEDIKRIASSAKSIQINTSVDSGSKANVSLLKNDEVERNTGIDGKVAKNDIDSVLKALKFKIITNSALAAFGVMAFNVCVGYRAESLSNMLSQTGTWAAFAVIASFSIAGKSCINAIGNALDISYVKKNADKIISGTVMDKRREDDSISEIRIDDMDWMIVRGKDYSSIKIGKYYTFILKGDKCKLVK